MLFRSIIGDRLDTDIWAGHNAAVPTLLVLTGVSTARDVVMDEPWLRPTYIGRDLRALAEPQIGVMDLGSVVRCGDAQATLSNDVITVDGSDPVNMLKAVASIAWSHPEASHDDAVNKIEQFLR